MKKLVLLYLMCYSLYAQWIPQISGTTNALNDCFFIDNNLGFAVGNNGSIIKTTNGGLNWIVKPSGTSEWFSSVHFMNMNVGIVVGENGTILKTTNGGESWIIKSSKTTNNLMSVSFCDAMNGYVCGANGTILRTGNGGETWTTKNSGTKNWLTSCSAKFPWLCYAVGDDGLILKTTNGGTSWFPQNSGTSNQFTNVSFINPNLGIVVGEKNTILKTSNGGITWIKLNVVTPAWQFTSSFMINSNEIVITGTDGIILRTNNGGADWLIQHSSIEMDFYGVFFTSSNVGTVVGSDFNYDGVIRRTTNGGYPKPFTIDITFPYYDRQCPDECPGIPWGWFFKATGTTNSASGTITLVQVKIDNKTWEDVSPDEFGLFNNWSHPVDISMLPKPNGWHKLYARCRNNFNQWSDIDSNSFWVGAGGFPHYRMEIHASVANKTGNDSIIIGKGTEFWVDINIDNYQDNNFQYASFELVYTHPEFLEYIDNEFIPPFDTVATKTVVVENSIGKISVAVHTNPEYNWLAGPILRIKFRLKNDAVLGRWIIFYFQNEFNQLFSSYPLVGRFSRILVSDKIIQWPGDANNNGIVEITDINEVVNHWKKTGTSVTGMNNWQGYSRTVWDEYAQATYADCDGNGMVNIDDIYPIFLYFRYTHEIDYNNPEIYSNGNPPIAIISQTQTQKNTEVYYDVNLGSEDKPVDRLKVLSFEMDYHEESMAYVGYEKDSFQTDANFLVIPIQGKISTSIYKSNGNISGYGNIIRFKFRIKDTIPVNLHFHNVLANKLDGSIQKLSPVDFKTIVDVENHALPPSKYNLYQNYPNPFK